MTTLTDEELGTTTGTTTYADTEQVYRGTFEGRLVGTATTAKQLETPFTLELQGDVTGNVDISGAKDVILQTKVSHATEADRADFAGNTALATHSNHADQANLANFAVESGKAKQTEFATESNHTKEADHALTSDKADLASNALNAEKATIAYRAYNADVATRDGANNVIADTYAVNTDVIHKHEYLTNAIIQGLAIGTGVINNTTLKITIDKLANAALTLFEFTPLPTDDKDRDTTKIYISQENKQFYIFNTKTTKWENFFDVFNSDIEKLTSNLASTKTELQNSISTNRAQVDTNLASTKASLNTSIINTKTELQNNINLVIQRIDKHEGSSAGSANARYLEKDMTDYFNTGALSTAIANNNFSELSVGNFITKNVVVNGTTYSNVKFYLAHFDYYYNFGDSATTKHHVLILPATVLGTAVMNDTNTTEGGYLNSKMRKTTLPLYSAGYQSAFGSAHILGWRNLVVNNVDKTVGSSGYIATLGASQQWEWVDAVCELMSESMVYGAPVWSSRGFDTGSLNQQLALFRFNTSAILANRSWYWLRNVLSSAYFCFCNGYGIAGNTLASTVFGVRPFALLI